MALHNVNTWWLDIGNQGMGDLQGFTMAIECSIWELSLASVGTTGSVDEHLIIDHLFLSLWLCSLFL